MPLYFRVPDYRLYLSGERVRCPGIKAEKRRSQRRHASDRRVVVRKCCASIYTVGPSEVVYMRPIQNDFRPMPQDLVRLGGEHRCLECGYVVELHIVAVCSIAS